MKVVIKSRAYLILIILLGNMMISNCRKATKITKRMKKYKQRSKHLSKSSTKNNFIWEYIKSEIKDPENILYFILGILSIFFSTFEVLYHKIKPIIKLIRPCIEAEIKTFTLIDAESEAKEKAEKEIKENKDIMNFELKINDPAAQKTYCKQVQQENEDNFTSASQEMLKNSKKEDIKFIMALPFANLLSKVVVNVVSSHVSSDIFCKRVYAFDKTNIDRIISKYGRLDIYVKQCIFFRNLDCEDFKTATGVWDFIKKAYSYIDIALKIKTCVINVVTKEVKEGNFTFEVSDFHDAIATVVGFVANIFTLGIWGGIKGGYYLIQLAYDIAKDWSQVKEHLAFNIGQTVGRGIMIAKSLLFGRKKTKRRQIMMIKKIK